jgi:hypothetical protein
MKKIVLGWMMLAFAFLANAQSFKIGDIVEVDKNQSSKDNITWISGQIIDVQAEKKTYVVKATDKKIYNISFDKEQTCIRRPVERLTSRMVSENEPLNCYNSPEMLKQKIQEEFNERFSEYDSITINYNAIEGQDAYKNNDAEFGIVNTLIYPFNVDFTVRLVMVSKDGTPKKMNWQFKRKYILFQNRKGLCDMTMAEKDENLVSNI